MLTFDDKWTVLPTDRGALMDAQSHSGRILEIR